MICTSNPPLSLPSLSTSAATHGVMRGLIAVGCSGQVQVADIGLMGGPAKHNGKAVEGVRIFKGGSVGEMAELGTEFDKGIACVEEVLLPKLRDLLVNEFGATPKAGVLQAA